MSRKATHSKSRRKCKKPKNKKRKMIRRAHQKLKKKGSKAR